MQDDGAAQLQIIAFSKNRAFQLSQLLRSLSEYVLGSCSSARISVIYALSPGYDAIAESYETLRHEHAGVRFMREAGPGNFQEQLMSLIAEEGYEYIMWAVDDLIFYRHFDVSVAMRLLAQESYQFQYPDGVRSTDSLCCSWSDSSIWCVHPKLHPGVTYSHTLDKPLVLPKLEWNAVLGTSGFVYNRADGMADWIYPWDLCGSIYRTRDVRGVMSLIESSFGPGAASHPNKLENLGHRTLIDAQKTTTTAASNAARGAPSRRAAGGGGEPGDGGVGDGGSGVTGGCRSDGGGSGDGSASGPQALRLPLPRKCACSSKPVCSVVTINRVQDVYDTPVYSPMTPHTTTSTQPPHADGSIHSLEDLGRSGVKMDLKAYARASLDGAAFNAVHIGHLLIESDGQTRPAGPSDAAKGVSVLLPARNAVKSIEAALTSVINQELPPSVALEVIVVDDASTDGTAQVCERVAGNIQQDSHVTIKVLRRETQGNVAVALSQSLERATYPLIARMDADDVCLRGRLMAQIEYLLDHPECDVVGGGLVVIAARAQDDLLETITTKSSAVLSVAMHPCDPWFLKWSLLFSCPIAHPSVMARVEALQRVGGYRDDPSARHAEDYDLWLRLCYGSTHTKAEASPEGSNRHRPPVANLPQPLILLRRTPDGTNASTTHREEQKVASDAAASRAMTALLGREVDVVRAAAVRRPEGAATVEHLISAVDLLLELEEAYLTTHVCPAGSVDGQGDVWRRAVREDVSNRLRAMAAVGIASYGLLAMKIVMKSSARKSS